MRRFTNTCLAIFRSVYLFFCSLHQLRRGETVCAPERKVWQWAMANQIKEEFVLGDIAWVRIRNRSWWPAQVVDENCVSKDSRPKRKSAKEILVRVYGSYRYLYVNPLKYRAEFENTLKRYNGSYKELFQNYLEKDVSRIQPDSLKRRVSETGEESAVEASSKETPGTDAGEKKQKPDSPGLVSPAADH